MDRGTAVVTGASSGIGAATAKALAQCGYTVVLGARRTSRLAEIASEIGHGARYAELDVADPDSVDAFCAEVPDCRLLVNSAGGAIGDEPIACTDERDWQVMYESNVLGVLRMVKALLPKLIQSGDGHIVTIGSVGGFDPYERSGGYVAAKHAVRGLMGVLRLELLGEPVRLCEVDPGMVTTEFSLVRFGGDEERAAQMYSGMTPLEAADVAECVAFIATRPSHVNVDQLVVRPRDQARPTLVYRRQSGDATS